MSLPSGTRIGPYEIVSAIGAGGMGEVYKARDTKLNREVALKILPELVAADPERLARFRREAQVLASLNHPHIAQIYGFEDSPSAGAGQAVASHALVMELVSGDDLSTLIAHGPLPLSDALPIARQIAEALEAAHEQGIIHRDLKPANVKVRADGTVKVLDFGLAKALAPEGASATADAMNSPTLTSPAMTRAGMILGTAAYMAPEQARGRIVDRRADIWAFGVVLFEMLTGRRAFHGDDITDTIVSVVSKEPEWNALSENTPAALRRLLVRCLKKDPKARLRDIGEARVQIEELLSGAASEEMTAPASVPNLRAPGSPARSAGALTWMLAGSTIAFAIASLWLWTSWRKAPLPANTEWRFARRTFAAQAIFNARFMPDGQTIIFSSALSANTPGLFESRPDSLVPRAFGPPNTHLLSISRSGELAVLTGTKFLGHRLMSGTLARMRLDGAPRPIADDVREADWLADGSDLAVIRDVPGGDQLEFPAGHVVHRVTGYLSDPRVSPDGTRVAFMEHPAKFDDRGWVKVVNREGVVTTIAGEYSGEEGVAWSADSRTVFFATTHIFSVPANGGSSPKSINSSPGSVYVLDVAADGRMIVIRDDSRTGIAAKGAGQDRERDFTTTDSWGTTLSADGRFVVFTQDAGTDYSVVMRGVDGSPPVQLGPGNSGAFSPDGRWVTANLYSTGKCVVYPTGSGAMVPVEMGPLESCEAAGWFPDGKHLIVRGKEKGQPTRTYRVAFPGGTPERLLPPELIPQGMGSSADSRNGSCMVAVDAHGAWRRFDVNGPAAPVAHLARPDTSLSCSADGRLAFAADNTVIPARVYRVNLVSGERQKIGEIAPADAAGLLSVFVTDYREGGLYSYWYLRSLSALYLATAGK